MWAAAAAFFLTAVLLSADYACWFAFDRNLFYLDSDTVCYADSLSIDSDRLKNAFVLFTFDLENNSKVYFGPSSWSHKDCALYFFPESTTPSVSFSEFFTGEESTEMDKEKLREMAYAYSMQDLYAMIEFSDSVSSSEYPLFPERFSSSPAYGMFGLFFRFMRTRRADNDFAASEKMAEELFKMNRDDMVLMKIYLYTLMDNGKFYNADKLIADFYKKREKDVTYFSLKANMYAIKGMFEKAEKTILEGRQLFPQSITLINDAINIYSVTDSSKMEEAIRIRDLYLK